MRIYRAEPQVGGSLVTVRLAGSAQFPETEPRRLNMRRDLADYLIPSRQIALAILCDALSDELRALSYAADFDRRVIRRFDPARPWELNSDAVRRECINIDIARQTPLTPPDNENLSHEERVARVVSGLRMLLETYPLEGALPVVRSELELLLSEFASPPTPAMAAEHSGLEREIAAGLANLAQEAGITESSKTKT